MHGELLSVGEDGLRGRCRWGGDRRRGSPHAIQHYYYLTAQASHLTQTLPYMSPAKPAAPIYLAAIASQAESSTCVMWTWCVADFRLLQLDVAMRMQNMRLQNMSLHAKNC